MKPETNKASGRWRRRLSRRGWMVATLIVGCGIGVALWIGPGRLAARVKHSIAQADEIATTGIRGANAKSPTLVRVMTLRSDDGRGEKREFTGRLVARYQTSISFRVGGKVVRRYVEVGDRVQPGDLLFELDTTDFELQLAAAKDDVIATTAATLQARRNEARLVELLRRSAASQTEYDASKQSLDSNVAILDAAEKRFELAARQLEYATLRADHEAIITSVAAETGEVVAAGQPVAESVQRDELEIEVDVPEQLAASVSSDRAFATFWTRPEMRLSVTPREISPIADISARMYRVRYRFDDQNELVAQADGGWKVEQSKPSERLASMSDQMTLAGKQDLELRLGMTATIQWIADVDGDVFVAPLSALANLRGEDIFWSLAPVDGSKDEPADRSTQAYRLVPLPVTVMRFQDNVVYVRGDRLSGKTVATAGVQKLDELVIVKPWVDGVNREEL